MRKKSILGLIIFVLFVINCKRAERSSSVKTELIDGIPHVFNAGEPIRGKISLDVAEVLRIDPHKIGQEKPPLFGLAAKDNSGNLYLGDQQNVRVYKFDSGGKLLARFLGKGQGPGEFPLFSDLQLVGDHMWVIGTWPMKIAKYTLDGQYVNEWMFRTFQNFYLRTRVIDEDRFLTVCYRSVEGTQGRHRVSALINSNEEFLAQYREDKNAGIFRIRTGQQGPAIVSTSPLVAADIHHAYDRDSGAVFVCNNSAYEISSKNPDGTNRMVIHNAREKIGLDDATKENILQLIAPRIPLEARQQAKEQLAGELNMIWRMEVLPDGNLAVWRMTGLESVEIDLFDREGRLLYTILPSAEIPDLRAVTFYEKTIGIISELEEKNVYIEYRVKNLGPIFD